MNVYRIQTDRYHTYYVVAHDVAAAIKLTKWQLQTPDEEILRVEFSCASAWCSGDRASR